MKTILTALLTCILLNAGATNYYVSATGSDGAAGTSPGAAWRTLAKVNSMISSMNAADSILLRRGDIFYGSIVVGRNTINIDAYGTGARPLQTGFTSVTGFTPDATMPGVYKAAVNAKSNLILVTINNIPQQIGRYPNTDAANGGYLYYEVSDTAADYIADAQLAAFPDWTNADVAIRGNDWTIDVAKVKAHKGNNVYYQIKAGINSQVTPNFSLIKPKFGYWFQNDKRTLDKPGEWWFDAANDDIYIYTGGAAPTGVRVATVDTLIDCNTRSFISIKNIDFEGTNVSAVFSVNSNDITVKDCGFTNIGAKAVFTTRTGNVLVENCSVYNCLSNAIQCDGRTKNNITIRNVTVKNNAMLKGMGSYYDYSDNKGIVAAAPSNVVIENCRVDSCSLAGIDFNGSNVLVQNNIVNYFCIWLHDEGGIYTYKSGTGSAPGIVNRVVKDNTVMYGYGDSNGTPDNSNSVAGIYLDGISSNVLCTGNTIAHIGKNGFYSNNFYNISIISNTVYDVKNCVSTTKWDYATVQNLVIRKNIFAGVRNTDMFLLFANTNLNVPVVGGSYENYVKTIGSIDSNYYYGINDLPIGFDMTAGGKPVLVTDKSLAEFKSIFGFEKNAVVLKTYKQYNITALLGSNLVSNGTFTTNVTGWNLNGSNTNWLWNAGTGRMSFFAKAPTKYSLIWAAAGAISTTKKYVFRFTTAATGHGNMQGYMRSRTTYADIILRQTRNFETGNKLHEFLFAGPATAASAAACIAVDQSSATVSIDNIQLYECNATINNISDSVTLYSNLTSAPVTVTFTQNRKDAMGTPYNGKAIIPGNRSLLLFFQSNIVTQIKSNAFLTRKRK